MSVSPLSEAAPAPALALVPATCLRCTCPLNAIARRSMFFGNSNFRSSATSSIVFSPFNHSNNLILLHFPPHQLFLVQSCDILALSYPLANPPITLKSSVQQFPKNVFSSQCGMVVLTIPLTPTCTRTFLFTTILLYNLLAIFILVLLTKCLLLPHRPGGRRMSRREFNSF